MPSITYFIIERQFKDTMLSMEKWCLFQGCGSEISFLTLDQKITLIKCIFPNQDSEFKFRDCFLYTAHTFIGLISNNTMIPDIVNMTVQLTKFGGTLQYYEYVYSTVFNHVYFAAMVPTKEDELAFKLTFNYNSV